MKELKNLGKKKIRMCIIIIIIIKNELTKITAFGKQNKINSNIERPHAFRQYFFLFFFLHSTAKIVEQLFIFEMINIIYVT